MSNWMKSARSWLGLGSDPYYDEEYDQDYDETEGDLGQVAAVEAPEEVRRVSRSTRPAAGASPAVTATRDWDEGDGGVRVITGAPTATDVETRGVVRPLPSVSRPQVVSPGTFNDVQEVADAFKRARPVIVNLHGVERDLSRRIIDFASGLCYGLDGNMERVADQVFLLTPSGAQVSEDDRRAIRDGSLLASAD